MAPAPESVVKFVEGTKEPKEANEAKTESDELINENKNQSTGTAPALTPKTYAVTYCVAQSQGTLVDHQK